MKLIRADLSSAYSKFDAAEDAWAAPHAVSRSPERGRAAQADHQDYGTFTFLFQQDVGGLEVLDPVSQAQNVTSVSGLTKQANSGRFLAVPPMSDAIVFNIGNALEWMTNGEFKSAMHRVTPTPSTGQAESGDRHSFGYVRPRFFVQPRLMIWQFSQPNRDFIMRPIPGTG